MTEYIFLIITSTSCGICTRFKKEGVFDSIEAAIQKRGIEVYRYEDSIKNPLPLFLDFIILFPSLVIMPKKLYNLGMEGKIGQQQIAPQVFVFNAKYERESNGFVQNIIYKHLNDEDAVSFLSMTLAELKRPKMNSFSASPSLISQPMIAGKFKPYPRYTV